MSVSSAVDASAVARVVGIKTDFRSSRSGLTVALPQRIAVFGQGSTGSVYSTDKRPVFTAFETADTYGHGSPLHLAVSQLLPLNGDGVRSVPVTVYPLQDALTGTASVGDITPAGAVIKSGSFIVRVNNIDSTPFVVNVGDSVEVVSAKIVTAISGILQMPIIPTYNTTDVITTSKWRGTSANDIIVEVIGPTDTGMTFAVTQPVGGLVNPDIDAALTQVGDVWETMILNCLDVADVATLDKFSTWGEGRWGALTRRPVAGVFVGNTEPNVISSIAISDSRRTDRTNAQLVSPGSNDLPLIVAARQVARIASLANNDPAHDYGSQQATGLMPGLDGDQWNYIQRDTAVKSGSSTVEVKDGVVNLSDIVTFYHPTGDPLPAYRYVVDNVKVSQILFNLDLIFATADWDGAPLIPDDQPTANRSARKPKTAVSAIAAMIDSLAIEAIIVNPEAAKESIIANINSQNPKRLDVIFSVELSGNTNIISIDFNFGFNFGTQQLVS